MTRLKDVLENKGILQTWLSKKLGAHYNLVNNYDQYSQ